MAEQTIQSQDIKVAEVFQAFYAVPDYQREYVWEADQVEQLLGDIYNEAAETSPSQAPEYFIGSIVVCPGSHGVLDLIDGQQRMTTLFLTLCAIRDRFKELGQTPPGALGPQIAATSTDAAGADQFRYRLELQYEDSGDVLERIATEQGHLVRGTTRSISNIMKAYGVVLSFLRREFGDEHAKLRTFYGYLSNKVKLIRIQTEDVAKALKIFETINDRGVGLDAMDLLKNLLFMKASREQFDLLKTIWKQLQDTIYGAGEKPLRFLRYFIFSRYDVDILREDQIYSWFARNEAQCGYASAPINFAKELLSAAQAYARFLNGCGQSGAKNRYLENLQLLGGKAARQHLILLLAGRHLSSQLFDRLAQEVEDLFFVYVITREATRDFERNFARWAAALRKVHTEAELNAFVQKSFGPAKAGLSMRFDDAFRRLYVGVVQQYRLRYILAKITQFVDLQGFGETEGTKWLGRYTSNGFEIEHIFPQTPTEEAELEFGPATDTDVANRLGNLVLVEKSINASLGNGAFSKKRGVYLQSQLLLTRALSERPKVGANTRIDAAVAKIEPFETWNEQGVTRRQEMLGRIAREVWSVPALASI
jgi:Protein of unknown function DUF262/Protein of unknown function (DUF1524)